MVEMKSRISWTSASCPSAMRRRTMAWAENSEAQADVRDHVQRVCDQA